MARLQTTRYRDVLRLPSFRAFWVGFTCSAIGDAMTKVALIWFVYQTTHSPQAVGGLLLCYTGPVVVGGLLAGSILDRFDRRTVMLADNAFRGVVVATIPILSALGRLSLWEVYIVAAVYGLLYMLTLAGGPALVPALVPHEQLATANALETLSFTVSGVCGPALAGLLIARFGAPNVVLLDAVSYAVFALALLGVRVPRETPAKRDVASTRGHGLGDAARLVLSSPVLLSTTLMFMLFNVGEGFLSVWLPVLADGTPGGGSTLYGVLLTALALGEMAGALLAGGIALPLTFGTLICIAQALSGASLSLPLINHDASLMLAALLLLGLFSAPLTIWAQTLRMRIIPEPLRGRTFALLRTLMQGSGPLASAIAGLLLPVLGLTAMMGGSALVMGLPGIAGLRVRGLRQEGRPIPRPAPQSAERSGQA